MASKSQVKDYYKNTHEAGNEIVFLHEKLVEIIESIKPHYSVFEFGCGTGKNLDRIRAFCSNVFEVRGLDISPKNLAKGHDLYNGGFGKEIIFQEGDESRLKKYKDGYFTITFTCSVLDHIEDIDEIIKQFKRITTTSIILVETNTIVNQYYFAHNYESYGFKKINFAYKSKEDKAIYEIWRLDLK